jgi:hypothetical protein
MNGGDAASDRVWPAGTGPERNAGLPIAHRLLGTLEPIAMAVLFFTVLTPIGLVLRLAGRDRLRLRPRPDAASYWLPVAGSGRER